MEPEVHDHAHNSQPLVSIQSRINPVNALPSYFVKIHINVTALEAGRSRVPFPLVSLEFFIDIILPATPWSRGSLRNEYQEYFLGGGKDSRCVGLTSLLPSCAECLEIWKPQPAGTLRACPRLHRDCFIFCCPFNVTHPSGLGLGLPGGAAP
jgi:hypothetical protein